MFSWWFYWQYTEEMKSSLIVYLLSEMVNFSDNISHVKNTNIEHQDNSWVGWILSLSQSLK